MRHRHRLNATHMVYRRLSPLRHDRAEGRGGSVLDKALDASRRKLPIRLNTWALTGASTASPLRAGICPKLGPFRSGLGRAPRPRQPPRHWHDYWISPYRGL